MGLLRNRRGGDDEEAPQGVYRMREKMIAIGDDFWIENGAGQRVFKVNGKAMRIRDTLIFEAPHGHELLKIQERKLSVRDTYGIEIAPGEDDALIVATTVCIDEMAHHG